MGFLSRAKADAAPSDPAPTARRVLVVDDVPEMADALRELFLSLRGVALSVDVETDGHRALRRVSETPYDLVLSDVNIPHVDGFRILAAAHARHPVGLRLVMTAYPTLPGTPEERKGAAIDGFVRKPLRGMEFRHLLLELLQATPERVAMWRQGRDRPLLLRAEDAPSELTGARYGEQATSSQ